MANEEHLGILRQGVGQWNAWREKNPEIRPDLTMASLWGADLSGANLREADLRGAILGEANLSRAYLSQADLRGANLHGAILGEANLYPADLSGANLRGVDLSQATVGYTTFGDVDLSEAMGLDTITHTGPSTIGIDTIYRSRGKIPDAFLRGAGVPDSMISSITSLVGKQGDYYSCFISYSSKDKAVAEQLHADLRANGVNVWFAPEHLKIGDNIRPSIDEAIRVHDKLLLVLSENSIASDWVEDEAEAAMEKERKKKRKVLFPINLDEAVWKTRKAWAAKVRRQRNIGDFTCWRDHDAYQKAFERLLRDLKASEVPPE